jgi:hypothetical protein
MPGGKRRDWIEATAGQGMAAKEPRDGKTRSAQRTMNGDGGGGVFRARGQISATARTDGVEGRRKPAAIESDDGEQAARHEVGPAEVPDVVCLAAREASAAAC